jgi:nucleoid DNA-binding protein
MRKIELYKTIADEVGLKFEHVKAVMSSFTDITARELRK